MELADEVLDLGPGPIASPRAGGWNVHCLRLPQPGLTRTPWGSANAYCQAAPVNQENHGRPQEWQVTDPSLLGVMDRIDGLETTTANLGPPRGRAELKPNLLRGVAFLGTPPESSQLIALPPTEQLGKLGTGQRWRVVRSRFLFHFGEPIGLAVDPSSPSSPQVREKPKTLPSVFAKMRHKPNWIVK